MKGCLLLFGWIHFYMRILSSEDGFTLWEKSDDPDFPAEFMPLAKAQGEALAKLRERNDVRWTFISPAGNFQADGERSGRYILAGEELTLNSRGESLISYADYAIVMVDEIEKGDHIRQRISVVKA